MSRHALVPTRDVVWSDTHVFYSPWALRQTHTWLQLHNLPAALAHSPAGDALYAEGSAELPQAGE